MKQNEQIIGVIDDVNVYSKKCKLKDNLYHESLWKKYKKRWRYNKRIRIDESALSEMLSDKDIARIKDHLKEVYNER